ncbi:helix-turn-helix domain-containing protein [Rhizobium rhododendri]|uniref:Helix-turn-helix domain-containing protein n=1 Tax=Rhizobium rhododendri TaxID=2506430 RepID=A0ABY8IK65_9HYPH|nr:helix-turn-helix domain-containing protein [Rhizobium rhododendri]WFS23934.1 helix-turn-helix domain-containing protein [Rhizobium rhododendri]
MLEQQIFLTGPQVQRRYQITEMTLWRWQRDKRLNFPMPMRVNRRRLYLEQDLVAWELARKNP